MQTHSESRGWPGVFLVWAIALTGALVVVALAYGGTGSWFGDASWLGVYEALGVVLAASVLAALVTQLASRRPVGFVARASASVGGAVVVVALAAAAVAPVAAAVNG